MKSPFDLPKFTASGFLTELGGTALAESARLGRVVGNGVPIPQTRVQTSHGYTLRTRKGTAIGGLDAVRVRDGRQVRARHQIGPGEHGRIARQSAGAAESRTMSLTRIELWAAPFEKVFGDASPDAVLDVLTNQASGLVLRESLSGPDVLLGRGSAKYQYNDLWFTDVETAQEAGNNRVVIATANLSWAGKVRIT